MVNERWQDDGFMMQSLRMTEARELQHFRPPAYTGVNA